MSMDRLVKLQASRHQKFFDHVDLLVGRLKAKDEDEDDIELIEAQQYVPLPRS
jgi:hypothetical protein